MAYFTVDESINVRLMNMHFSGTGPHYVPDELLARVQAELTASGRTVTPTYVAVSDVMHTAVTPITTVLFVPPRKIVVTAIKVVPSAAINGDDTDNFTLTFGSSTIAAHEHATVSTWAAKSINSMTITAIQSTIDANDPIILTKSTKGSGLITPGMQVLIEYKLA